MTTSLSSKQLTSSEVISEFKLAQRDVENMNSLKHPSEHSAEDLISAFSEISLECHRKVIQR